MRPNTSLITINDNLSKIESFINNMIIIPRRSLHYWSEITNQTPAAKIGYIGQHLASLITGIPGTGSGARGDDLADGTEVKSCNKIDQADKCKDCGNRVMRQDTVISIEKMTASGCFRSEMNLNSTNITVLTEFSFYSWIIPNLQQVTFQI